MIQTNTIICISLKTEHNGKSVLRSYMVFCEEKSGNKSSVINNLTK